MSRLAAITALRAWIEKGGPGAGADEAASEGKKGKKNKKKKAPEADEGGPYLLVSDLVVMAGDDGNVAMRAVRDVGAGELLVGVATRCTLHPRSAAVPEARRVQRAAAAVRAAAPWRTPLLDGGNEGWIELVVLLALELLDGEASLWWPYLRTLPRKEHAMPASLWALLGGAEGIAAQTLLEGTSVGALTAFDVQDLATLLGGGGATPDLAEILGTPSAEAAREALLHAIGLTITRAIEGVGLVPFVDLVNGNPTGRHNATIERTNLARSMDAVTQEPCCAIVSAKPAKAGEEIVLAYGKYSAAEFLYRYGWVEGGPSAKGGAESPHDKAALSLELVWSGLSDAQRGVLEKHGLSRNELEEDVKGGSPFAVPAADAAKGSFPPLLQQVALIACCEDPKVLQEIADTGKSSSGPGVKRTELAQRVAKWCAEQVLRLCAVAPPAAKDSDKTVLVGLAARVRRGERELLLKWIMGLQRANQLPNDILAEALQNHTAACKQESL
eukprot:CAMPEP_0180745782 /NCGR_PEP_ID=MMETSP1038_2-20121128/28680_1 /TAXON_ID=632150 /ORGANISM="Azadinium spinosum, Strain 3D9" /LENGTH=499 /DNA_ID=CAMNT_0022779319 /DNA_START=26 /DNA_END=1525 /DNA_ORIENTATION=+